MDIAELAGQFNVANYTRNDKAGYLDMYLYETVRKQGGKVLLNLSVEDCQTVGLAFSTMALFYEHDDMDFNCVDAENAYYCMARSVIEADNALAAPAIYALMQRGGTLMKDMLIGSLCTMLYKRASCNIYYLYRANPYKDPRMNFFREIAIEYKDLVGYYALLKFYDVEKQQYKISTDLPFHIPTVSNIKSFLARIEVLMAKEDFVTRAYKISNSMFDKNEKPVTFRDLDFEAECKEHFYSVYRECENVLKQFYNGIMSSR